MFKIQHFKIKNTKVEKKPKAAEVRNVEQKVGERFVYLLESDYGLHDAVTSISSCEMHIYVATSMKKLYTYIICVYILYILYIHN